MLAGEIPVDGGVVVTDGQTLLFSPVSFGLPACLSLSSAKVGGVLLDQLRKARQSEKRLVTEPFTLKKVASCLPQLCKNYADSIGLDHEVIPFHGVSFSAQKAIRAFDAVGSRACGFLVRAADVFDGKPFLIIEPEACDVNNDIHAVLLSRERGRG